MHKTMLDSSLFGRTNDTEILNQSNEFFIIFLLQTDTVGHRWTSIFSALGAGGRAFESPRPDQYDPMPEKRAYRFPGKPFFRVNGEPAPGWGESIVIAPWAWPISPGRAPAPTIRRTPAWSASTSLNAGGGASLAARSLSSCCGCTSGLRFCAVSVGFALLPRSRG